MDPLNKIKFVDEDGSSVILDVPMTARGERKEALPIDKMNEIEEEIEEAGEKVEEEIEEAGEKVEEEVKAAEEKVEEEIEEAEEKVEEEVKAAEEKVEEEVKAAEEKVEEAEEKVEKELQEVNALVNDIKEQGMQEVANTIENIEIKIKPPKGCCVIQ
jgi:chromosome segregation ATPase